MWGKQTRNLAESATWKSSQEARCIQWLELSKQGMRKKQDMWRSILDIRSGLLESSEAYYQRMPMKKLPEQGKELSTISSLFLGTSQSLYSDGASSYGPEWKEKMKVYGTSFRVHKRIFSNGE